MSYRKSKVLLRWFYYVNSTLNHLQNLVQINKSGFEKKNLLITFDIIQLSSLE